METNTHINQNSDPSDLELENVVREIVSSRLAERKMRRPGYSLRAYARDLAVAPSALSGVLNGKRKLTPQLVEKLLSSEPTETRLGLARQARDMRQAVNGRRKLVRVETPEYREFLKIAHQLNRFAIQQVSERPNLESDSAETLLRDWIRELSLLVEMNRAHSA